MYEEINNYCREKGWVFHVLLMSETEPNRHWNYEDYKTTYTTLLKKIVIVRSNYTSGFISSDLKKRLIDIQPNIVIAGGAYIMLPVLQSIFYKKQLGYKLFFWSESNLLKREKISFLKSFFREIVRRNIYKLFDGFWNAGRYSNDFINKYKKKNVPSFFMPNLIDSNFFYGALNICEADKERIKREHKIDKSGKIILSPARLSYEKGLLEFLDIYADSNEKRNAVLLIVGDGPLRIEIENKIRTIAADIRLLGYKNQEEILDSVFCLRYFSITIQYRSQSFIMYRGVTCRATIINKRTCR
ncbi:MAG: glycosyltransferase [Niabella sp.]